MEQYEGTNYPQQTDIKQEQIQEWESPYSDTHQLIDINSYLRKVFLLVTLQMFITTIISVVLYHSSDFQQKYGNVYSLVGASMLLEAFCIIFSCNQNFLSKYPLPIFIIFTFAKSFVLSMATTVQKSTNILNSLWISTLSMLCLTIYVYSCRKDLKSCLVYGFAVAESLICYHICVRLNHSNPFSAFWVSFWSFISTSWLINDAQNMLDKKTSNDNSWGSACASAVNLYLDILCLLRCLKKAI